MLINRILFLIFFATNLISANNERCSDDEECKHIKTCEERKFFLNRNVEEIRKLKVCGSRVQTREFCCKKVAASVPETELRVASNFTEQSPLSSHRNSALINNPRCGKAIGDRIIGGSMSKVGSQPWMALLYYKSELGGRFSCGGSLISPKYVLTAAHCLFVPEQKLFSVRLGEHRISTDFDCTNSSDIKTCNTDKPPIQDIEIEKTIVHESYQPRVENDIALLRLKAPAVLRRIKNVRTICLPMKFELTVEALLRKEEEKEDPMMTIAGWGITENDLTSTSDVLMEAYVPFVTNDECSARYDELKQQNRRISVEIKESFLCAGGNNKTDACNGDSGGPLMYHAKNDDGQYRVFQQGVTSQGIVCSSSILAPGIYSRVFSFMEWILDNLEE